MNIFTKKADIQYEIARLKNEGKSIGFVPTMGALHDGHLSLVKKCHSENDITIVSIFVNPTQFNNPKDLQKYPRTLDKDVALLQTTGDVLIFAPTVEEMYDNKEVSATFDFDFGGLDSVMEGRHRPGHFNGVVQVVSKLFDIVTPDKAYFGQKDFQQLAVIRRMVQMMNYPIEIIGCPIIREANGLAMSSRNQNLSSEEHKNAINISRILEESRIFANRKSVTDLTQWVSAQLNAIEGLEVEYFEIVDGDTLQTINHWDDSTYIVGCITVYCGETRLIDNIQYK